MPDVREKLVELRSVLGKSACWAYDDITDVDYIDYEETAKNLIANGVTIQRWIPVTERLPETFATVLIYTGSKVHEAFLQKDRKWLAVFGDSLIIESSDVTHWMPLPEPPEEE